jgi:TolA-binding protein
MWKLGMSEQKLGHADKAKDWFAKLAQRFPESPAAHRLPQVRGPTSQSPDTTR